MFPMKTGHHAQIVDKILKNHYLNSLRKRGYKCTVDGVLDDLLWNGHVRSFKMTLGNAILENITS